MRNLGRLPDEFKGDRRSKCLWEGWQRMAHATAVEWLRLATRCHLCLGWVLSGMTDRRSRMGGYGPGRRGAGNDR